MFLPIKLCTNFKLRTYAKLNCKKLNCFVCKTELFEMELFLTKELYLS